MKIFVKVLILLFITLSISNAFAGKKKEHRHHEAHVHGSATLNIAFDNLKGKVEFKAASEGILGFEHEAKSEKDKKKLADTLAKFETSINSMVKFESTLDCVISKEKIENQVNGHHVNFIANFNVECKKDLKGSKLTFDFSEIKGLKDLDVTLLIGDLQKNIEIKRKPVTVELK